MEQHKTHPHHSLLTAVMSIMMSFVFLASPPFERNPQQCEMVREISKPKKKE